jgi:hypothetical protein
MADLHYGNKGYFFAESEVKKALEFQNDFDGADEAKHT